MQTARVKWSAFVVVCLAAALYAPSVQAAQEFKDINRDISDGKDGRPFAKWSQSLREEPVKHVVVYVQRISGGDDTFINLRFGDKGQTLEGGRRVHLTNDEKQKVKFEVGGQSPNGQPLVLNAYEGVVKLRRVDVQYQ